MKSQRNSLRFETLEAREVHAVGVSVVAGDLIINGDAGNDQIQMSRLNNGAVRVQGVNGTLVNGTSFVDRFFSDDIAIHLGNGNNSLTMLNLNGGINADDVSIRTGSHVDNVIIYKLNVRDDLNIFTGSGNDYVYVNNVVANNQTADSGDNGIGIFTQAGSDRVDLYNTRSALDINVLLDDSTTWLWSYDDTLNASNVSAADDLFLYGFAGNDKMRLSKISAGDILFADLGSGNDSLYLVDSKANSFSTHGGAGSDTLQYYNNFSSGWPNSGWERFINGY